MAERLGFDREEALTLECALARLTAHAKGVLLVIFELFTPEGLWVPAKDLPTRPESVERYLSTASSAMAALGEARTAMEAPAGLLPPAECARLAFRLYEQVPATVPSHETDLDKAGTLDLGRPAGSPVESTRSHKL